MLDTLTDAVLTIIFVLIALCFILFIVLFFYYLDKVTDGLFDISLGFIEGRSSQSLLTESPIDTFGESSVWYKANLYNTGRIEIFTNNEKLSAEFYLQNVTSIEIVHYRLGIYKVQINGKLNQKDIVLGITHAISGSAANELKNWLDIHWKKYGIPFE